MTVTLNGLAANMVVRLDGVLSGPAVAVPKGNHSITFG